MTTEVFTVHQQIGLKIIGTWPGIKSWSGFFAIVGWAIFLLIFGFWNIVEVIHDLDGLMDNLVSTIGTVMGILKLTSLKLKSSTLMVVINKIIKDGQENPMPNDMMINFTHSKLVSKSIVILYNMVYFTYVLKTLISYAFDSIEDRKYLAAVSFPVDGRQSPLYELVFIGQFILAFSIFNVHALIEGLLASSVLHACSKITTVRNEIIKFSNICQFHSNNKKLTLMALQKLTQTHLNFVEFSENVQDIFSYIAFFHIFCLTLIQVLSGYMFIDAIERSEKSINLLHYATLTIVFLVSSGYYCIAGEYLTNQSELIFLDIYNCFWYKFHISEQKSVNFMLLKARKPVTLTFGKFDDLSLLHLTKIMKTSFSYLSLVRAVR